MAALTTERASSTRFIRRDRRPLAAVKATKGGLAAVNAAGFYLPATGAVTEVVVGKFTETVDNSGGAAGAKKAEIDFLRDRTVHLLNNDSGNAVVIADRERPCFVKDDQTVSGDETKAAAGIVYDVVAGEGVWVEIGNRGPQGEPGV